MSRDVNETLCPQVCDLDALAVDVSDQNRCHPPTGTDIRSSASVPSGSKTERNMPRRTSRQQHEDSNALTHSAHPGHTTLSMPSASRSGQTGIDPLNRNSTFSSTSAGSLSFSGQSGYSAASPPTPVPGHVSLDQQSAIRLVRVVSYHTDNRWTIAVGPLARCCCNELQA